MQKTLGTGTLVRLTLILLAGCSSEPRQVDSVDAGANACVTAGGECVGLSPQSCTNGTVGDITLYGCGGGVGVECCLPGTDGGQDAGHVDAGTDAGHEDAGPASCTAAGGQCVAVVPGACAGGIVGDGSRYTCGSGVGTECCFPAADGGHDAGPEPQDAGPTSCAAGGGQCVAVVPGACAGGMVGEANIYSCGSGVGVECCFPGPGGQDAGPHPADAGPMTCTGAGGQCVAVVPNSCPHGTVGDSRLYSCGGGLGVECCLP